MVAMNAYKNETLTIFAFWNAIATGLLIFTVLGHGDLHKEESNRQPLYVIGTTELPAPPEMPSDDLELSLSGDPVVFKKPSASRPGMLYQIGDKHGKLLFVLPAFDNPPD
jgi:hypothetical protein